MDGRSLTFALLVAVSLTTATQATQFFVSISGSDSAAGTSAAPWRSLQHAADVVGAGDKVTVRAGNYTGFYLDTSGTAAAPIEFVAEPGVLIDQRNATTPDGINLESASYITIDGFSVSGMPRAGVRSVGLPNNFANFVTIRNVTATSNGVWGIFTGHVNDLLIESNQTSGSIEQHGIYVSNSGDRPVIRNNTIFDNHGSGIHMNGDLSQGGDGIISGAVVSGNRIYNNAIPNSTYNVLGGGSGINMDGVQNSRIENNLLFNNHASGISLYRIDGAQGSSGNVVANNSVIEASDARWALNIQSGSSGNTVRNNILLNNHSFRGAIDISPDSLSGFSSDYNAVISRFTKDDGNSILNLAQWQAAGYDAHSFASTAAALFVNPATNDYRLKVGSPAINAATNSGAPFGDLLGLPRPAGGITDVGAYESGALSGDFNRDGVVSASDYIVWRNSLGTPVTRYEGADATGNGVIDQADYALWRAGYGAVATATGNSLDSSAAPESTTIMLLAAATVGLLLRRSVLRGIQLRR
jgi:parallel beta-helix repeat protein